MKIYVAGKVSNNSSFGTHDWRDGFVTKLSELSGIKLENLDPTKLDVDQNNAQDVFGADADLIKQSDVFVVYLSDDISVGGSQEILIAKYYKKPVIGLAPRGGKFNGSSRKIAGKMVSDYKDPFVFSTCDVICNDIEEVAVTLKKVGKITPKTIDFIEEIRKEHLKSKNS